MCEFGCGEAFKDPARRIKHHLAVHQHQGKVYKKRFKVYLSPLSQKSSDKSADSHQLRSALKVRKEKSLEFIMKACYNPNLPYREGAVIVPSVKLYIVAFIVQTLLQEPFV